MKTVFCDTSGLYAMLTAADSVHERAASAWKNLLDGSYRLVTTNYVAIEAITLIQMRYGLASARSLHTLLGEFIDLHVLLPMMHERAVNDLFHYDRRALSLVDCSSFVFMRHNRIETAFAYDPHFEEHGFTLFN